MAIDVPAQILYWKDGAAEELDVAQTLLTARKLRQAGFFIHLAVEKALKARVVAATHKLAPKIHDLLELANRAKIELTPESGKFLGRLQTYCFEGRYPDKMPAPPLAKNLERDLKAAEEIILWLNAPLKNP